MQEICVEEGSLQLSRVEIRKGVAAGSSKGKGKGKGSKVRTAKVPLLRDAKRDRQNDSKTDR